MELGEEEEEEEEEEAVTALCLSKNACHIVYAACTDGRVHRFNVKSRRVLDTLDLCTGLLLRRGGGLRR